MNARDWHKVTGLRPDGLTHYRPPCLARVATSSLAAKNSRIPPANHVIVLLHVVADPNTSIRPTA